MSSYDLNLETAPATGGDKFVNADHEGELLVLAVTGTGRENFDEYGEADFLIADVTVVDGPNAGEQYEQAWLFGRVLFGQLKRKVGRTFVGRLGKGEKRGAKSAPWQLNPVSQEETQQALDYMRRLMREQTAPPAPSAGSAEAPAPTELGADDSRPPWAR